MRFLPWRKPKPEKSEPIYQYQVWRDDRDGWHGVIDKRECPGGRPLLSAFTSPDGVYWYSTQNTTESRPSQDKHINELHLACVKVQKDEAKSERETEERKRLADAKGGASDA